MKPFVYLDNWHVGQPATRFEVALEGSGLPVSVYRTNRDEFPASTEACGVFIGPSKAGAYDGEGWIQREHEVLRGFAQAGVPMLGLCFGSQVLASALLGPEQVFKRGNRETGYAEIEFTPEGRADPLTRAFPPAVRTFHWHGDEVRADHPDAIVLARNAACGNQLWRWRHGPVWGVQPHPEMDRAQICEFLEKNREWFRSEGKDVDAMIRTSEDNEALAAVFDRFLSIVREPTSDDPSARAHPT